MFGKNFSNNIHFILTIIIIKLFFNYLDYYSTNAVDDDDVRQSQEYQICSQVYMQGVNKKT